MQGNTRQEMRGEGVREKVKIMLASHAAQGVHRMIDDHRERVPMKLLQERLEQLQPPEVVTQLSESFSCEEGSSLNNRAFIPAFPPGL